jgi:tripartite-type tricarboxylate transporter receptor subunit TctC
MHQIGRQIFGANSVLPHINSGRLRALGVSGTRRTLTLPDAPSIAEAGVSGYEVVQWSGILAPAGTPGGTVGMLNRQINEILKLPAEPLDSLARSLLPKCANGQR